ncbi:hypothetical protein SBA4_4590015 [Candidatus Sulfopaludibacter sp. SbA4]|nr:hypothetical protein SBA4_4590015 [Candidatus Sulfopaludibacter sp. SbA4]
MRSRNAWPGNSNAKPPGLYDRRNDDISVNELERQKFDTVELGYACRMPLCREPTAYQYLYF